MTDLKPLSELPLADCSDLELKIERNFQPMIFRDIDAIAIEAIYKGLIVK
jgi:hypothetical protein